MARDPELLYRRHDHEFRLRVVGLSNHELREVLVGLWARLDPADRADHINELLHYAPMLEQPALYPDRQLSGVAAVVSHQQGTQDPTGPR